MNNLIEFKMKLVAVIQLVLFAISLQIQKIRCCPAQLCVCKWKNGKQTVECYGTNSLTELPDGMDPGTQVLNFSDNSLKILKSERFYKMNLINLQKIYLSRNQLIRIHDKAFKGLSNLVELDMSENHLTTVPSETFQDYSSLMRLSLNGNPIRELKTNAFRYLSFLTTLELSNCQIDKIENEAFIGMDNLEWLRLDGNRIGSIKGNHILPKSLHGINLHGNRWNCDCRMVDLHEWLINYNIPQQIEEPKCLYPQRLNGEVIKFLRIDELACLPDITPTTLYLELAEGRNISLICKINAIPDATVSWWFQGQLLQNDTMIEPNLHLYYYIEEDGEEKRSELFIYNTKSENNGTFSCIAENLAGRTQTNYTIRVIVKQEPIPRQVQFPFEHLLLLLIGAGVTGFIIVLLLCCLIFKCIRRTKSQRRRKQSSKGSTIQLQNSKSSSIISETTQPPIPILKPNGSISLSGMGSITSQQEILFSSHHHHHHLHTPQHSNRLGGNCDNENNILLTSTKQKQQQQQYCSPQTSNMYHDQNPDLINDAESNTKFRQKAHASNLVLDDSSSEIGSNEPSSTQKNPTSHESVYHPISVQKILQQTSVHETTPPCNSLATIPHGMVNDIYQHQVDIHLNPGCFLNGQECYPVEYRMHQNITPIISRLLQPMSQQQQQQHQQQQQQQQHPQQQQVNYYRTLPHKARAQMSIHESKRFSKEAEYLLRSGTPPLDGYALRNMRYTVEGYPFQRNYKYLEEQQQQPQQQKQVAFADQTYPSPPDEYKCDNMLQPLLINNTSKCQQQSNSSLQQWPSCLPVYQHLEVIPQHSVLDTRSISPTIPLALPATTTLPIKISTLQRKRCISAHTLNFKTNTIDEQQENNAGDGHGYHDGVDDGNDCNRICVQNSARNSGNLTSESRDGNKNEIKQLNGPLADSPDEGYVGDSQDGSDM